MFAPVSGEVIEVNENLNENPEIINQDPYGKGWIIKIKMSDESELSNLLSPKDYKELVQDPRFGSKYV